MNKTTPHPVSTLVRRLFLLIPALLPFVLGSCSSSRSIGSDKVLDPGMHSVGTLVDSDVLVPKEAALNVDYAVGNRIFVQSGGTLSGFSKGAKDSIIYAEQGALIPTVRRTKSLRIVAVDDAEEAFRNRFKNLLPPGVQGNGNPPLPAGVIPGGAVVGAGWWGGGFWGGGFRGGGFNRGGRGFSGGNARATSVRPSSYRSRN